MRVKHLLKSAPHQHKDAHVRLECVETLDAGDEDEAEMLAEVALRDTDSDVRVAAIGRIVDLAILRELLDANGDHGEVIRTAAEGRLNERIESGEVSDVAVRALLESHADQLAVRVASNSPHAEQRAFGLEALEDEASLVVVVQQSRLHDARVAAATRLTRHDAIRSALAACRSRDKEVARLLQQRLDAEAAAEAERIATRHAVSSTLESMQQLGQSVWSPQTAGKAQMLRERWSQIDAAETRSQAGVFAAADAAVRDVISEHERDARPDTRSDMPGAGPGASTAASLATSSDDETSGEPDATGDDAVDANLPVPEADKAALALAERLEEHDIASLVAAVDTEDTSADSEVAGALRAHARAVAVLFDPPFDYQRARPAALQARIQRVAALLDTRTLVPGLELSKHAYVTELSLHHDALVDRLGKSRQESADRVAATHRQFAALGGIISEGKWAPANSLLRRLQKKLAAMEPAERATLDDKLARAEKQLAEMGDWQDFAARPKLEALCAEMEALPAKELDPPKLAREVRDLQSQWKSLGPSRAANELWPRFKTAGDAAYEPCKAHFAQKNDERQVKMAARRAICEALEADVGLLGSAMPVMREDAADGKAERAETTETAESAEKVETTGTAEVAETAETAGTAATTGTAEAADKAEAAEVAEPTDQAAQVADTAASPRDVRSSVADPSTAAESPAAETASVPSTIESATEAAAEPDDAEIETVGVGPEPDWKLIQRRVSDAKREWSKNRVTDRKPDRKLEARFSQALKPFESALKRQYRDNEKARKALIEKAAALASGDINQHVANQAKTLLSAWKLVGIVPRRVDQKLWETFNGHLGSIFKHQQAVAREKRRAGFEHVDRARAIAKELRTLARGDKVDESAVQALVDEFNALPDFPDRDRRGLERDFRGALDATARVQENAGKRRQQAEQEERQRLVELCERLETAVEMSAADSPDEAATLIEDVRHAWEASDIRLGREMALRLEARRDAALALLENGGQFDHAANEEIRRDLLIRMEVAADMETPPEDKARRMRFQLENLQAGMTSAAVADRKTTLAALEEDWLVAAPASRSVHGALQSRYLKAMGR